MILINENKCMGCGACVNMCPDAIKMENNKAVVVNQNVGCLKEAHRICPVDAFYESSKKEDLKKEKFFDQDIKPDNDFGNSLPTNFGQGHRMGRGRRKGKGYGHGMGFGRGQGL